MITVSYSVSIKALGNATAYELTGDAAQAAYGQIMSHRDVMVDIPAGENTPAYTLFIRYEAIESAKIQKTFGTAKAPTDAFCGTVEEENP